MKAKTLLAIIPLLTFSLTACGGDDDDPTPSAPQDPTPSQPTTPDEPDTPEEKLTLVWQDDFDAAEIDTSVWSRIPEGTPDWAKCQSLDNRCYEKRESSIVLRGIVNDNKEADKRDYLCGGLWTNGKKAFGPGRIEVRARMTQAQGAWPAIWMMPFKSERGWPYDGEIDIMEHLNYDGSVYQTLHSGYIDVQGNRNNPLYSKNIRVVGLDSYHTYAVDIKEDCVILYIDGTATLTYPKIDAQDQLPYYRDWDLRIDMQLGGSWVGAVQSYSLPVEMEVDWVKYYTFD